LRQLDRAARACDGLDYVLSDTLGRIFGTWQTDGVQRRANVGARYMGSRQRVDRIRRAIPQQSRQRGDAFDGVAGGQAKLAGEWGKIHYTIL